MSHSDLTGAAPNLTVSFAPGHSVTLLPSSYLYFAAAPLFGSDVVWCSAVLGQGYGSGAILGAVMFREVAVTYDNTHGDEHVVLAHARSCAGLAALSSSTPGSGSSDGGGGGASSNSTNVEQQRSKDHAHHAESYPDHAQSLHHAGASTDSSRAISNDSSGADEDTSGLPQSESSWIGAGVGVLLAVMIASALIGAAGVAWRRRGSGPSGAPYGTILEVCPRSACLVFLFCRGSCQLMMWGT